MAGKVVFETMGHITAYDLLGFLRNYTEEELKRMELLSDYRKSLRITADKECKIINIECDYLG